MNELKNFTKVTSQFLFVIILIFFSTAKAQEIDKFNKANNIADYFSGIVLLNQNQYEESQKYLKKLHGLEKKHRTYSSKYLYSLINSGNFNQAYQFSRKLRNDGKDSFESDLISGIYFLKNSKFDQANKFFLKAKNRKFRSILDSYIANSLFLWSNLSKYNLDESLIVLNQIDQRLENLKRIQEVFIHCYYDDKKTDTLFYDLIKNNKIDFSRYNFFYAKYLESKNEKSKAKEIINNAAREYPRNLLINQKKLNQSNFKDNLFFDCREISHVTAEMIYIAANALSSQNVYQLSNFYLNLAKYLNSNFIAYDNLLAENFLKIDNYLNAKNIYKNMRNFGEVFKWYSNKQISRILILEKKKEKSLKLLANAYEDLKNKGIYETFDYAEFLKNNEQFQKSISYYSQILEKIDDKHVLYPEVTDGRGVSYERVGNWELAEKDLQSSLLVKPDQAYVINYLAYSWIEKGIKIEESLKMLEKANQLKSNDPYIIDSLGWALFKLERYKQSKEYLQLAVRLMPEDPIVNDHYGDALWKNGKEIQARYYWKYVLGLEKTEKDLKEKLKSKLIKGL